MLDCCMNCRKRCEMNPYFKKNRSDEYKAKLLKMETIESHKRTYAAYKNHHPEEFAQWKRGEILRWGKTYSEAMEGLKL